MKDMIKQISYVKGLAEGLEIESDNKENRVLIEVLKALDLMAESVEEISSRQEIIIEVLEDIDEDLYEVEEFLYDDDMSILNDFHEIDFDDIDPVLFNYEECEDDCVEECCSEE